MQKNEKFKWIVTSFVISILLLLVKFYGYYMTQSNAILTDALESIVNVVASGFAFYSIYLAAMPRDDNHPYGHGKIEFFSAGLEGVLIILAGIFIIYQSIHALIVPVEISELPLGMALVGFSGAVNAALGITLTKKGKALNSLTLEADGKHVFTDAISSFVLLVGIGIMYFSGFIWMDSLMSLVFAGYILFNGYFLVRKSVAGLMDEINPANLKPAVKLLNKHRKNSWIDIHNMRIQQYGGDRHIDLHLTLPYYFDLRQVHDEVEQVEAVLENELPGLVEVFIHADPCIPEMCCHYCLMKQCPVRKEANNIKIKWTSDLMSKNQKHYHESTDT